MNPIGKGDADLVAFFATSTEAAGSPRVRAARFCFTGFGQAEKLVGVGDPYWGAASGAMGVLAL